MRTGRPRSFCKEEALDKAMTVFWRQGYEGASMADLTKAMAINPPSLYAMIAPIFAAVVIRLFATGVFAYVLLALASAGFAMMMARVQTASTSSRMWVEMMIALCGAMVRIRSRISYF